MTTAIGSVFTLAVETLLLLVLVRMGSGLFSDGFRRLKPIGCGVLLLIGALWFLSIASSAGRTQPPSHAGHSPQMVVSPNVVGE
ncbi:MAG: hypothetical protein ACRENX_01590 [Candidatus Dormibacteria bacterium]